MICARCKSPLLRVAAMIGNYPVGPVCAKRLGLVDVKKRTRKTESCRQAVDDPRQLDWIGLIPPDSRELEIDLNFSE